MAESGDFLIDYDRKSRGSSIPDISLLNLGAESVEPMLCREHSQKCNYFCKAHMTELCITCRRLGHKNCKTVTVIDIEEAAEDIYNRRQGEMIIHSVEALSERFKKYKAAVEYLKDKVLGKRKYALGNVKQAKIVIETSAVAEID